MAPGDKLGQNWFGVGFPDSQVLNGSAADSLDLLPLFYLDVWRSGRRIPTPALLLWGPGRRERSCFRMQILFVLWVLRQSG